MFKNNNLNFDNIKPSNQSFSTKKIKFRDRNDLILNVEKKEVLIFQKNLIFLFSSYSFFYFFRII